MATTLGLLIAAWVLSHESPPCAAFDDRYAAVVRDLGSNELGTHLRRDLPEEIARWETADGYRIARELASPDGRVARTSIRYEVSRGIPPRYVVVWVVDFGDQVRVISNVDGELFSRTIPRKRWEKSLRQILEQDPFETPTVIERIWHGSLYLVSVCDEGRVSQFGVHSPISAARTDRRNAPSVVDRLGRPSRIIAIVDALAEYTRTESVP